jgi:hypothetical protein
MGEVGRVLEIVCKQRDTLKFENEALREIIKDLNRKRLADIDELTAHSQEMRAIVTDLTDKLKAVMEG